MTVNKNIPYTIPEERHIYVSARLWHEVYPKVDTAPFIYKLYEEIDFESYGPGLKKFYFTFIVLRPGNQKHQPGRYFNRKQSSLEVAIRLPYAEVKDATQAETFRLMEAAFLQGIDQIGELQLAAPFDYQAFRKDVEMIFANEDWYADAVPTLD